MQSLTPFGVDATLDRDFPSDSSNNPIKPIAGADDWTGGIARVSLTTDLGVLGFRFVVVGVVVTQTGSFFYSAVLRQDLRAQREVGWYLQSFRYEIRGTKDA